MMEDMGIEPTGISSKRMIKGETIDKCLLPHLINYKRTVSRRYKFETSKTNNFQVIFFGILARISKSIQKLITLRI